MQKAKKILALALAVMMVVSMFSVVNFSSFATEATPDVSVATLDETNLTDTGKTISIGDAATNGAPNVYKLTGGGVTDGKLIEKISFDYKIYHGQSAEKNKNMYVLYWYKDENNFAAFNICLCQVVTQKFLKKFAEKAVFSRLF